MLISIFSSCLILSTKILTETTRNHLPALFFKCFLCMLLMDYEMFNILYHSIILINITNKPDVHFVFEPLLWRTCFKFSVWLKATTKSHYGAVSWPKTVANSPFLDSEIWSQSFLCIFLYSLSHIHISKWSVRKCLKQMHYLDWPVLSTTNSHQRI